jgi:xanthine dehydrogenase YagR molybdenum-binding subunit
MTAADSITSTETATILGPGVDRVDGPLKVTGTAPYPSDVSYPNLAHAALVRSTVACGRISGIDTHGAESARGVLAVLTHLNVPRLERGPVSLLGPSPQPPLQTDRIVYHGQYVALVVASTPQQAAAAAQLVKIGYDPHEALLEISNPHAELKTNAYGTDTERGDVDAALATAEVTHEATYTTAENTNNPMGLFATVAAWDGETVTVHDSSQWTSNVQATIAEVFGLEPSAVRVHARFVGGAFGAGLRVWQHVILAVLAARAVGRPVKLILTRPQMFTGLGHRPNTEQRVKLGARRDGELVAIDHEETNTAGMEDENFEPVAGGSAVAYACPNVSTRDLQRRLNIPPPGWMRGPGEAEGTFALESAIDELAYKLRIDPLDLRLRNYAEVQPQSGLPWASKALRECYEVGAERFGWSRRDPEVGAMCDGQWQVGYGLAGLSYSWWQVRCNARATINRDGTAFVCSAANDLGTGTATVMQQLSADLLGLSPDRVTFGLGDSAMPWSPAAGGSGLTASVGNAVHAVCQALLQRFLDVVADDERSPLRGCSVEQVRAAAGQIRRRDKPSERETYTDILNRHGLDGLTADAEATPPTPEQSELALSPPFAAKFVEVRVDADLGLIRIARVLSVIDAGRILNEKLARSQIIGGTVGGIGQALLEETITDPGTGRVANATLGDYLVPVNADVLDIDVIFVGKPDPTTALGAKGVGEIGLLGIGAAVANAIYHATGRRIRSLPITIEQLL